MPKKMILRVAAFSLILGLIPIGSTVFARVDEGYLSWELYVGNYDPDPDFIEDDFTAGFRLGGAVNPHFGWQGQIGFFDTSEDLNGGVFSGNIDFESWFLEVSFIGYLRPDGRVTPNYFGGIGGAFTSLDGTLMGPGPLPIFARADTDSLTLHAGIGVIIDLTDTVYLQPAVRYRGFEARDDNEIDQELTLAIGFRAGP